MTLAPASGHLLRGRYQLERELGRGASGSVWLAHDRRLDRAVAVKLLGDPQRLGLDTAARERLLHEARVAAGLNHPSIVAVHDVGEDEGRPFVVMELVPGGTLRAAGPLPLPTLLDVARQLAQALAHAHGRGIVHRDVKPENIMLVQDGEHTLAKLADLGIAHAAQGTRLTSDGAILGTAAYLAPEQALGSALDGRADLYALGVVLYEQVAGRVPFEGDALAVISQHLYAPVTPPRTFRPGLPAALEGVILRLLAKDPAQRFADAAALDRALATISLVPSAEAAAEETSAPVVLLEQLVRGRLVGRGAELDQLRSLFRLAQHGHAHLALVSGEPGAGKTRLAHELLVYAQLSGASVLRGGCYEYEATTPYLPFVEALRAWVRAAPDESLAARLGDTAAELARLAPEIAARLGPFAPAPALAPHEERLRLFDSLTRFLQALAREPGGVVVFVDDLHWADQGTLAMLHYALRQLREERLLVLATYREIELDRAHPLAAALVEWNRERLATRLALGRLDRDATAALLATLFSQETVSPEFAAAVHRETEGNPFFVEEVVKALIEQGQIYREAGSWERRDVAELTIPQSVKSAIGRRLDRLTPACLDVLHTCAALGKSFAFAELAASSTASEDACLDALDEAARAQLVRDEGRERFVFTHDKIREVLYEELNPVRRRRLHQRIGEALERLHAKDVAGHVQDLAHHFLESGDLARGLEFARAAAEQAGSVFAHDEALAYLTRARECAEALEDEAALSDVEERTGLVHDVRGDLADAVTHYERALEPAADDARRAALHNRIADVWVRIGDPRGLPHLEQALRLLDRERQPAQYASALTTRARYAHYQGHHAQAVEELTQALAIAEPAGDPALLERVMSFTAGAYQHLARYEESDAMSRRCIALGERIHDPALIAIGHEFMGENAIGCGRWEEALAHGRRDYEIARAMHSNDRASWGAFVQGWALAGMARFDEAEALLGECVTRADQVGEKRIAALASSVVTWEMVMRGSPDAEAQSADALARSEAVGLLFMRIEARRVRAIWHAVRGEWQEVLKLAAECEALVAGTDAAVNRMSFMPLRAEAHLALGQLAEAETRASDAVALAARAGADGSGALAERALGHVALAAGRADEFRARTADAATRLEALSSFPDLARTLGLRARALDTLGDTEAAAADRARAEELVARFGISRAWAALDPA
ncbi:MAG TPA: AAA family ATPase [Candidatus Eisenbacteria bacterium]|nr:AAA family ATPase [Candidatus Eisenbacteria bacterium]